MERSIEHGHEEYMQLCETVRMYMYRVVYANENGANTPNGKVRYTSEMSEREEMETGRKIFGYRSATNAKYEIMVKCE